MEGLVRRVSRMVLEMGKKWRVFPPFKGRVYGRIGFVNVYVDHGRVNLDVYYGGFMLEVKVKNGRVGCGYLIKASYMNGEVYCEKSYGYFGGYQGGFDDAVSHLPVEVKRGMRRLLERFEREIVSDVLVEVV